LKGIAGFEGNGKAEASGAAFVAHAPWAVNEYWPSIFVNSAVLAKEF
jgi:hypothetical protein